MTRSPSARASSPTWAAADGSGEQNRRGESAVFGKAGPSNETRFADADAAMKKAMAWPEKADSAAKKKVLADWDTTAEQVRRGERPVATAYMTNFQLRRVTSSYLCEHSAHDPRNKLSRCGMALGTSGGDVGAEGTVYGGQFIVGGWCIGTVLDNSASRAAVGHQVRSAVDDGDQHQRRRRVVERRQAAPPLHGRRRAPGNDPPPQGHDAPPRRANELDDATSAAAKRAVGLDAPPYRRCEASAVARDAAGAQRL